MTASAMPWREVEPAPLLHESVLPLLDSVDTLRTAWKEWLQHSQPEEFEERRKRSLRRHAIETGIIERLYDIEWGVTEALVAEGITLEVASREGGVTDDALNAITTQFEALQFLASAAREGRPLTVHFVRQLHEAITSHQATYEARNTLGQWMQAPLHHGTWKQSPNHVVRRDGTTLQYTPPERVQDQMEALIEQYADTAAQHPVARAAWLHHRFICIHPFEDGNGRVARALTLLVLLKQDYAPLVVDRLSREDYISALDYANDGDLAPLVRLFAGLEIVALRSELEESAITPPGAGAVDIARSRVDRLRTLRQESLRDRADQAAALASALQARVLGHLEHIGGAAKYVCGA